MSAPVLSMPSIPLDANGVPRNHKAACHAAQQELADFVNELPDGFYHMTRADCELAVENIIGRYLQWVKHEHPSQRAR